MADTSGQEPYKQINAALFASSSRFLGVFDLTNADTVDGLKGFLVQVKQSHGIKGKDKKNQYVICGSKSDLIGKKVGGKEFKRCVTESKIREVTDELGIMHSEYIEVSGMVGTNFENLVEKLFDLLLIDKSKKNKKCNSS